MPWQRLSPDRQWRRSRDPASRQAPTVAGWKEIIPLVSKANEYRKRAADLSKGLRKRSGKERPPLLKKQKALSAMAENEDWLDGKPRNQAKRQEDVR